MDETPLKIYETLLAHYGDPGWWPADTPYEVMLGAVLTQNTAWGNVRKALAGFGGPPSPEAVESMGLEDLKGIIRPAGSFVRKADTLRAVTAWFSGYGCSAETVKRQPLERLREELLLLGGVGPETADAILLYAFGFPAFVIDAYTLRLCARHPVAAGRSYMEARAHFEACLPRDAGVYNRFHALVVANAKAHCRKKPSCGGCPFDGACARLGVSP